ncbi:MAG: hypothetical protein LBR78_03365 [Holosporales bacterium]|jgi:hypothetical protein|nr:hypothetical protein [Holosporales bacterium]
MIAINYRWILSVLTLGCVFSSNICPVACGMDLQVGGNIGDMVHQYVEGSELAHTNATLGRFLQEHSRLRLGMVAMGNLYDSPDAVALRATLSQSSLARNLVYAAQLLIAASCSVVKYLSGEYPDETLYGNLLIGLYVGKMLSWGLGACMEYNSGKPVLDTINALHGDDGSSVSIATMASCVCDMDNGEIMSIATAVRTLINKGEIIVVDKDQHKWERLNTLIKEIGGYNGTMKKCVTCIARFVSLFTGITAGAVTSLSDAKEAAFWMKISSNAMDAMTDHAYTFRTGEVVNKYVATSEIMYLCEYFLSPIVYEL